MHVHWCKLRLRRLWVCMYRSSVYHGSGSSRMLGSWVLLHGWIMRMHRVSMWLYRRNMWL